VSVHSGARSPDRAQPRPAPELASDAHKGQAGRVLCVCGSRTMPGAAILVARAAARAGAGLVSVACLDEELLAVLPGATPESVLVDWTRGVSLSAALAERADDARVAGPGMGASERTHEVVTELAHADGVPLVLDADALNVLAGELESLETRKGTLVLTPHPGEAARLLGRAVPRDSEGRAACAREIARRSGGLCVLKGAGSMVSDGNETWVNPSGNPGMATGGAGDVLTGILGAYLAACAVNPAAWTPFEATCRAVFVHGRAGDLAAETLGRRAVIASDLIEYLAAAQRTESA